MFGDQEHLIGNHDNRWEIAESVVYIKLINDEPTDNVDVEY